MRDAGYGIRDTRFEVRDVGLRLINKINIKN